MVWTDIGGGRVFWLGSGGGSCALYIALNSLLQMFSSCVEVQPQGSESTAVLWGWETLYFEDVSMDFYNK